MIDLKYISTFNYDGICIIIALFANYDNRAEAQNYVPLLRRILLIIMRTCQMLLWNNMFTVESGIVYIFNNRHHKLNPFPFFITLFI